jgi:hypothetical protein
VSVAEALTLDPERMPIERLREMQADGIALSDLGRERLRAAEQNAEKAADDFIAA